jgi:hypothetical protein
MVAFMNRIIRALHGESMQSKAAANEDYGRSTCPDAPMNLLLRFETAYGPRTIVAPGISLATASEIALVMSEAGHFAEFVDHIPPMSVQEHVKRRKAQARKNEVISLRWAKGPYPKVAGGCELH